MKIELNNNGENVHIYAHNTRPFAIINEYELAEVLTDAQNQKIENGAIELNITREQEKQIAEKARHYFPNNK